MRAGLLFGVLLGFFLSVPAQAFAGSLPPLWPDAEAIEHFLKEADVVERVEIGRGITKPEKVTLEMDGVVRHAVFKRIDKDHDNWRYEVAAYELDKLLDLGMVPPTVERRIGGRKGCLQLWVQGVTMEKYEGTPPDVDLWRRQVSAMWLFDDLIANIDRHLNNAMVSPEHRLILIDNSKTFRSFRDLINDLNGPGTGTHARFWLVPYDAEREGYRIQYPQDFLERFLGLSDKEIKKAIGKYIWGYDKDLVTRRRKMIVELLGELVPRTAGIPPVGR